MMQKAWLYRNEFGEVRVDFSARPPEILPPESWASQYSYYSSARPGEARSGKSVSMCPTGFRQVFPRASGIPLPKKGTKTQAPEIIEVEVEMSVVRRFFPEMPEPETEA